MTEIESKKCIDRHQNLGSDDEPERKRQKPDESGSSTESSNDPNADAVEVKTITNIYYDCLERIFDFLDLEDLLMVANTCKRLRIAAAAKFGDDFGSKKIWLQPRGTNAKISMNPWFPNTIIFTSMKLCLSVLRCFGGKIPHSGVRYRYDGANYDCVDEYIDQYCADTLTSIEFENKQHFSTDLFKRPFKKDEKVKTRSCCLTNQLTNFATWFPNLRHLEMKESWFFDSAPTTSPTNVSFPHLEYLQLYLHMNFYHHYNGDVVNILQASPQLQSLTIWSGGKLTMTKILDAIRANPLIRKLDVMKHRTHTIRPRDQTTVTADELNRFVAEHPLLEELSLLQQFLNIDDAINFVRQMKSLKRFEFPANDHPEQVRIMNEINNVLESRKSTSFHASN